MDALDPVGGAPPIVAPVPLVPVPALVALDGAPAIQHMLNILERIADIDAIKNIFLGNVQQMTENLSRQAVNRGGAYIGMSATTKIKALIWWVQDARAQGNAVDPNNWDEAALDDARKRMHLEKQGRDREDDIVDAPKRLDPSKWVESYLSFINFLRGQISADGKRTLDSVVRKDPPVGWMPTSREDRLKYNAPMTGHFFSQDNQKVYHITKQWTLNSAAFAWVRPFDNVEDGRGPVAAMQEHYDGPGETAKKLAKSEAELKNIHYRNEQSMTFENYVNKLNAIFFVFAEAHQPLTPDQKVKHLCDKMTTSNTRLETLMTVIKMDASLKVPPEDYFVKAANTLAKQIATIFPNVKSCSSRYVSFAGRGGRGRGCGGGQGRGGRGNGGRSRGGQQGDFPPGLGGNSGNRWNGHNISDLTVYFPGNVFSSFPQALTSKIHHTKQSTRGNESGGGGGNQEKRNISFVEYDDM
jgi:hypothetical protein